MRDLTARQFRQALQRHGMRLVGFMGYVEMFDGKLSVSMLNANTQNLRARLAYLLREKAKFKREAILRSNQFDTPMVNADRMEREYPDSDSVPLDPAARLKA